MDRPEILSRIGEFDVPYDLLVKHPDAVLAALSGIIVVRAEILYGPMVIRYTGLGEMFGIWPSHLEPPRYVGEWIRTIHTPDDAEPFSTVEFKGFTREEP